MFANTNCPGKPLQDRLPELVRVVNQKLDGESVSTPTPIQGGYEVKSYKNRNQKEYVYQDSNCTKTIGSLNSNESCDCLGEFINGKNEKVAVVMYTIDGSKPADRKVGFVKYIGGIGK